MRRPTDRLPKYDVDPIIIKLEELREERELTRAQVGSLILTDKSRLGEYARGVYRPRIDQLRAWAAVLSETIIIVPVKHRGEVEQFVRALREKDAKSS